MTSHLDRFQRAQLIEEYIECCYEIDQAYAPMQEHSDREWLQHLDNKSFLNEMEAYLPVHCTV